MSKFRWINIFIRDFFLAAAVVGVNYYVGFQSWFAAFALGMIVVLTTWHLDDLIKQTGGLNAHN